MFFVVLLMQNFDPFTLDQIFIFVTELYLHNIIIFRRFLMCGKTNKLLSVIRNKKFHVLC